MDFSFAPGSGTPDRGIIIGKGEIEIGDDEKLHRFVGGLSAKTVLNGIVLDSPGGNYSEGVKLATTIRNTGLTTGAVDTCASACFLMFAAGTKKIAFDGARIGVHSASMHGVETLESQGVTTLMARQAADLGVPSGIIGRMVTTHADDMAWLSPSELRSMNVELVSTQTASNQPGYQPGSALRPGSSATTSPLPAPVPAPLSGQTETASAGIVPTPEVSQNFVAGRNARIQFQSWFDGLQDDMKAGAEWWAGVRSQAERDHLACNRMPSMSASWQIGCTAAETMLTPSDRRRRTDPEFKAGWNSF
jgi:hypothetical protein